MVRLEAFPLHAHSQLISHNTRFIAYAIFNPFLAITGAESLACVLVELQRSTYLLQRSAC